MKWSNDSHNSQEIFFCSDRLFTQSVKCAPTQQRIWNTLHLVEHIHLDKSFQYITKKKNNAIFYSHTHIVQEQPELVQGANFDKPVGWIIQKTTR